MKYNKIKSFSKWLNESNKKLFEMSDTYNMTSAGLYLKLSKDPALSKNVELIKNIFIRKLTSIPKFSINEQAISILDLNDNLPEQFTTPRDITYFSNLSNKIEASYPSAAYVLIVTVLVDPLYVKSKSGNEVSREEFIEDCVPIVQSINNEPVMKQMQAIMEIDKEGLISDIDSGEVTFYCYLTDYSLYL
jgi:hypothetical protein